MYTYLRARDLATGLPPNIEGGTPAPDGYLIVRYMRAELAVVGRAVPARGVATGAPVDARSRRPADRRDAHRTNIRSFFLNGATVRGWVTPGPDGTSPARRRCADRRPARRVAQIQDRVLGAGVASAPLFTAVPAYVTVGIRAGLRAGRHEFLVDAENLGDENYRGISWGVDAPGRGMMVKYLLRCHRNSEYGIRNSELRSTSSILPTSTFRLSSELQVPNSDQF